jgi:hypothetical protein
MMAKQFGKGVLGKGVVALWLVAQPPADAETRQFVFVELCSILMAPERYNNAFVETAGIVEVGRERFTLRPSAPCRAAREDPRVWPEEIWLEYGKDRPALGADWIWRDPLPEAVRKIRSGAGQAGMDSVLQVRIRGKLESYEIIRWVRTSRGERKAHGFGHRNQYPAQLILGYPVRWELSIVPR